MREKEERIHILSLAFVLCACVRACVCLLMVGRECFCVCVTLFEFDVEKPIGISSSSKSLRFSRERSENHIHTCGQTARQKALMMMMSFWVSFFFLQQISRFLSHVKKSRDVTLGGGRRRALP